MVLTSPPKALIFDVFGTVVDWRTTVERGLREAAKKALKAPGANTPSNKAHEVAAKLDGSDWSKFAQEWRTSYMEFCRAVAAGTAKEWKSVDQHHYDSLKDLLVDWKLEGLWSDAEIQDLSLIWHRLDPWKDSADGLRELQGKFKTVTLSNGNTTLLKDLATHGQLTFDRVISCEEFETYKPNPKTYKGAIDAVGFQPGECVMVAAHLFDLEAAKKCGLQTIYIARAKEEAYDQPKIDNIKESGDIDFWVDEHEEGILTVARYLAQLS